MTWITRSSIANRLISLDSIDEFGNGKVIIKASNKEFGMRFLTLGAKLAFAKLKQAFNIALILYYFD